MSSVNNSVNTPYVIGGGSSYPTSHGILTGNGTNAVSSTVLTDGQLLIGSTGNAPSAATITAGSGITVTNAAGAITIAASSTSQAWSTVTGSTQAMAVNTGYINNPASGSVTYTLPSTAAVGDLLQIIGLGGSGWDIAQNSSQSIQFGTAVTTTGTGGSLTSNDQYDNIVLRCTVANTKFAVVDAVTTQFTLV